MIKHVTWVRVGLVTLITALGLLRASNSLAQNPNCDQLRDGNLLNYGIAILQSEQASPHTSRINQVIELLLQVQQDCFQPISNTTEALPPTEQLATPETSLAPSETPTSVTSVKRILGLFPMAKVENRIIEIQVCEQVAVLHKSPDGKWSQVRYFAALSDSQSKAGWIFADVMAQWFDNKQVTFPLEIDVFKSPDDDSPIFRLAPNQSVKVSEVRSMKTSDEFGVDAFLQIQIDDGRSGWVAATEFSQQFIGRDLVIPTSVNVRTGPSINDKLIKFDRTTTLRVTNLSDDKQWLEVQQIFEGWVWSDFLEQHLTVGQSVNTITSETVNLRKDMDVASKSLDVLPKNTAVTIKQISQDGEWARISYRDVEGWIKTCLINPPELVPES